MTQVIGTKATAGNYFTSIENQQRVAGASTAAQVVRAPTGGWITKIGINGRGQGTGTGLPISSVAMAIWERLPNGQPGQLLARTNPIPLLEGVGQNVEGPLVWSQSGLAAGTGGKPTALRVDAGQELMIGWLPVNTKMSVLGVPSLGTATHYISANDTGEPRNPFGAITTTTQLVPAAYAVFEDSVAPTVSLTLPAAGASIVDDTPTFTGSFVDGDTVYGDYFTRYELQVRRTDTGEVLWQGEPATALTNQTEIASGAFSREYAGAALPAGVGLEWRARVQDRTGEWSVFSAWRAFSIAVFGVVDVVVTASPTGRVDGNSAIIDWTARWWHTGNLATNRVQVRVLDASGTVLKVGAEVDQVVAAAAAAPGTQFTIQDTVAGIGALVSGQSLQWQIRGRASNNVWSDWSTPVAFRTNALPTVPILVAPETGSLHTSRPILSAISRDADPEDAPLSGVVWDFELTEISTGTVRTALGAEYDTATGTVSLQTDPTLVPNVGNYSWRVRGRDVSAGAFGESAWSTSRTLMLSDGPVVTVTVPTEGEARGTTSLRVAWLTSEAQTSWLVQIYPVVNGVVGAAIHSSGVQLGAQKFYDVPNGVLQNQKSYLLRVTATNAANQSGTSLDRRFSVFFEGAQSLTSFTLSVIKRAGDVEPTTPQLTWSKTQYPTGEFRTYIVRRWAAAAGEATAVTLVEITNANQRTFLDYHAPPNTTLVYGVSQRILAGGDTLESADITAELQYALTVPVIVSIVAPATVRFPVKWLDDGYSGQVEPRRASYTTWETSGLPTVVGAYGGPENRTVAFTIRHDDEGTMIEKFLRIKAAVKAGQLVSFRDQNEQLFMSMERMRWRRGRVPGTREITIDLEETSYREKA